jgi:hypothetical protein
VLNFNLGDLAGPTEVASMQRALVGLAQETGRTDVNPGTTSGLVTPQTRVAVLAMIAWASKQIPEDKTVKALGYVVLAGQAVNLFGPTALDQGIRESASVIAGLAQALQLAVRAKVIKGGKPSADAEVDASAAPPTGPWYTTSFGIGTIVAGVLAVYLFTRPSRAQGA